MKGGLNGPPSIAEISGLMMFEVLYFPLMFPGSGKGIKGSQVAPFAGFRISFAGIEAIFAGFQFLDHNDFSFLVCAALRAAVAKPACPFV